MQQNYGGRHGPQPMRARAAHDDAPPRVAGPLIARFLEQDDAGYLVAEPGGRRTARVPKRRAIEDPDQKRFRSSDRLLRWSSYALLGVVCGGIVGIVLGAIVVLAALARLARLSSRIHRWLRRSRASGDWPVLPAQATKERIQLLAALGQGFLSMLLGSFVLFVIIKMR